MRFPGKHIILSMLVIVMTSIALSAQERGPYDTVRVYAYITPEGDTIPESILPPVEVIGKLTGKWKRHWAEWTRLRNADLQQSFLFIFYFIEL